MNKFAIALSSLACLAIGAVVVSSHATAGQQFESTVSVTSSHRATGSIGATRNSANTSEYIGCSYKTKHLGGGVYSEAVRCYARSQTGSFASCSSSEEELVTAVRALNDSSYMSFTGDSEGNCTELVFFSDSRDPSREF